VAVLDAALPLDVFRWMKMMTFFCLVLRSNEILGRSNQNPRLPVFRWGNLHRLHFQTSTIYHRHFSSETPQPGLYTSFVDTYVWA
jgi:hypothetical protein